MGWRYATFCTLLLLAASAETAVADPGEFTLHEVISAGEPINSLRRAYRLLDGHLGMSSAETFSEPLVNFMQSEDSRTPLFPGTIPFPTTDSGLDQNFAVKITAQVEIPTAGTWSFGMTSASAARLVINGRSFRDFGRRLPQTRIKPIKFSHAGDYSISITYFEHSPDPQLELYASPGKFRHVHARRSDFQLVGDTADGGLELQPTNSVAGEPPAVSGGTTPPTVGGGTSGAPLLIGPGNTLSTGSTSLPPASSATNAETWEGGGTYLWKINDAAGAAGSPDGWDEITMPDLSVSSVSAANPFTIKLESFAGVTPGTPAGLGAGASNGPFTWTIAHSDTPVSATPSAQNLIDSGAFALDTSGFTVDGSSVPASDFTLQLVGAGTGQDLQLEFNGATVFTATPEPTTALLAAIGMAPLLGRRPRRKRCR